MGQLFPNVDAMLAAHGITAPAVPIVHDGYSGAEILRIQQDGRPYLLKRVSRTDDWIIQMTSDHAMREAQLGASSLLDVMAPIVRTPSIAAAYDGDGFALLMHDLTPHLLPADGVIPEATWDTILSGVAALHARFWHTQPDPAIGWCGLRERLLMLSEPAGERLRQAGLMEFGFGAGWHRFHEQAPPSARELVRALHADPAPFVDVLARMPQTLLHNDVKTANIAIEGDTLWLFDWALAGYGPIGCDLGWLLAVNSSRLPWSLGETSQRYFEQLESTRPGLIADAERERQRAVAHISGLMMFGWAKTGDELAWWCDHALEARAPLRL